ncbi:MAG: ABC transporter ATP-binding protein [Kiritimatiellaeota bacterium]|nr:ABC transporter ATP-binding protein [Kiritimatiellota bacterium]
MDPLLHIQDLTVQFDTDEGVLTAVEGVSLEIYPGEVLGLVGESGCGKSVTAMSVLRLVPSPPGRITGGRILFDGTDLLALPIRELRSIRGREIGMIFQEPMTALSPLHRVGRQLVETLRLHREVSRSEAWRTGADWLRKVGVPAPEERMHSYPFQLSGGMRQRVMIATALMLEPRLVIADEPTTALDVTVQAQILDLMLAVKGKDAALLLITHDMGVIWETCDRVAVMYASRIVETGPKNDVFHAPLHPYTQGLLRSIPGLQPDAERLPTIPGQVPSLIDLPYACTFADRCPFAFERCRLERPPDYATDAGKHRAACFMAPKWARERRAADRPIDGKSAESAPPNS